MKKNSRDEENAAKRKYWEEQLRQWKQSGLTQVEYCRLHGLKQHQWWYWKKRIIKTTAPVKFVRLDLDPVVETETAGMQSTALKLVFGSDFHIEINKGFDPATLEQVIRTLQRC